MQEVKQTSDKVDEEFCKVAENQTNQSLETSAPHPLFKDLQRVIELKNEYLYAQADQLCWKILDPYGINSQKIFETQNQAIAKLITEPDRGIVAEVLNELALSFEALNRQSKDGGADLNTAKAIKLFLIVIELDPSNSVPIIHLASLMSALKAKDISVLNQLLDLPLITNATDEKKLADFQEQCLAKLLNVYSEHPYDLTIEHFAGERSLPTELLASNFVDDNDPNINSLVRITWSLADSAKLAVNIARYYKHHEPTNLDSLNIYIDLTKQFAGTLLNIFEIPRDPLAAQNAVQDVKSKLGRRQKNVVSALTNLASVAQMEEDYTTAKNWYKLALIIEPQNEFAKIRLEAINSGKRNRVSVDAILNDLKKKEPEPAVGQRTKSWDDIFQSESVKNLHPEIMATIGRNNLALKYPSLVEAGAELGKFMRVLFSNENANIPAYFNYLESEKLQTDLWSGVYEAQGFLLVQSHICALNICLERKLLGSSMRVTKVISTLEEIRATAEGCFETPVPAQEEHQGFAREVLNLILQDLRKKR